MPLTHGSAEKNGEELKTKLLQPQTHTRKIYGDGKQTNTNEMNSLNL